MKHDNIPGLPGYYISKRGVLWSRCHKAGHRLIDTYHKVKYNTSNSGYLFVQRRGKYLAIHRLVALVYVYNPDPKNKIYVCHKDNNKLNNYYKNLYWGTPTENTIQCIKDGRGFKGKLNGMYGRHRVGSKSPSSKLSRLQKKRDKEKSKTRRN